MPFLIQCTHKDCLEQQAPILDTTNNKVYCSSCDQELTGLTSFAKSQMKSIGQIRRGEATQETYSVKCQHCKQQKRPLFKNKDIICAGCKKALTGLSPIFITMLKSKIAEEQE